MRRMLRRALQRHEHQKIVAYIDANFQPMTSEELASSHIFRVLAEIERERRVGVIVTVSLLLIVSYFWGQSLVDYVVVSALQ